METDGTATATAPDATVEPDSAVEMVIRQRYSRLIKRLRSIEEHTNVVRGSDPTDIRTVVTYSKLSPEQQRIHDALDLGRYRVVR